MSRFKTVIINGMIMTATSLVLRLLGVLFNSYISKELGTEGMGIYSLVQSVFGFAVTFACSAINLGTTRLISEALAVRRDSDIKNIVKNSVFYSLFFSLLSTVILLFGSGYIGEKLLGDYRTVKCIKILAVSLPFISLSSVLNGYFSAVRRVYKSATVMLVEHFIHIFVTARLFSLFMYNDVEKACISVALGTVVAEIVSFLYNFLLYLIDVRKYNIKDSEFERNYFGKILNISIPLAFSAYARSGLITIEHLLIPYGLRKSGIGYSDSMSVYGLINGMVFPIIMFPSCIIYSFAGLIIPELAGLNEKKEKEKINKAVSMIIKYALSFAVCVSGIFICYSYEISYAFYNSAEAYSYLRLFAPLVTVMYLDAAVDGILKGLNEQLYSMKVNIADALLSVGFVYFLVPNLSIKGYIITVFLCEIFNCCMSLTRLIKICTIKTTVFLTLFKPLICIILSTTVVTLLLDRIDGIIFNQTRNLVLRIALTILLYLALLLFDGKKIIHKKNIPSFKNI